MLLRKYYEVGEYMLYFDSTMIILIPALLISMYAQFKVQNTFQRYSRVFSKRGITGGEVARRLLDEAGLSHIPVELIQGKLTDHYDPVNKVMRLSNDVYYGNSVASIGVAAHETGHAIQHKENYAPLNIRNSIVPVVNISSSASWLLFFVGMIFSIPKLTTLGILLFSAVVLFQIITLPVEFNASARAIKILNSRSILDSEEIYGAKKVLQAAALTYVAAAITAISQLLRLIALNNRNRD
ncbi:zinc metallopeptidase [Hathewaya histolytica]|uniref:Putative neutral zinc metallopeptidase n=2 Tax=Hathewaya histolytica TaxID=1498 RepID=A0A4U9RE87_HATHI|nr:putative neutral zinc metallopeptidase [Hathewaya histolytica]